MSNVFTARWGARFVDAAEVVTWISQRLYPIDNRPPVLVKLEKKTSMADASGFRHWQVEPLDAADEAFLRQAWVELPDYGEATEPAWPQYVAAFSAARKVSGDTAPRWELHPSFLHVREQSIDRQREIRQTCAAQMEKAFASGQLRGFRPDRTPASQVQLGVELSIDDARVWLERLGYAFAVAEAREGGRGGSWKDRVPAGPRAIMERHMPGGSGRKRDGS